MVSNLVLPKPKSTPKVLVSTETRYDHYKYLGSLKARELLCRARAGLGLWPDQKLRASSLPKARENRSSRAGLGLGPRPVAPLVFNAPPYFKHRPICNTSNFG